MGQITVFGALPVDDIGAAGTLSSRRISVEAISANLRRALGELEQLASEALSALNDIKIEHIDVQIGIGIDGSVGILGAGVGASASGALTVRLVRGSQHAAEKALGTEDSGIG